MNKNIVRIFIYLGVIILFVGMIALFPAIFSSHELLFQIIAVVLSVLFTAVVTNTLLTAQSQSEEDKEKNIKIHEGNIRAYSSFTKHMWKVIDDEKITENEIIGLRTFFFDNLIFHLDKSQLSNIQIALKQLYSGLLDLDEKGSVTKKAAQRDLYIKFATQVANCLKDAINPNKIDERKSWQKLSKTKEKEIPDVDIKDLFGSFSSVASFFPGIEETTAEAETTKTEQIDNTAPAVETTLNSEKTIQRQSWHFSMWDYTQLDFLDKDGRELSLVEYGEYWRTNLVKQVKPGDLVFLFKGNKQYAGAFLATGWRVFEYDEERNVREIVSEGITKAVVLDADSLPIESVAEQLSKHDFYKCFLDPNSTSCANIIVEPVSYIREGVPNPNTTYRKTISRYYGPYAAKLLQVFADNEKDPEKKRKINQLFE